MSIPNRQIGWSQETYLWWEVLNALSKLKSSLGTPPGMPIFTTTDNKLYELNVNNGIATELSIPSFPTGTIFVIHNDNKLYLNNLVNFSQATSFWEYDITLNPWSATFVGTGTLPWATTNNTFVAGSMQQNELSKGWYIGTQGTDSVNTVDLTNLSSIGFTPNFTLPIGLGDPALDILQTTDNKLIVSVREGTATIKQFDLAGNLELSINLGLNFGFYGVVVYKNQLYLVGSDLTISPINKLYKINHEPPYNLTFIADIDTGGSRIISVSQVPRLCTRSFQI